MGRWRVKGAVPAWPLLTGTGTQFLPLQNEEVEDGSDGDNGQINAYHAPDSRETSHSVFLSS